MRLIGTDIINEAFLDIDYNVQFDKSFIEPSRCGITWDTMGFAEVLGKGGK